MPRRQLVHGHLSLIRPNIRYLLRGQVATASALAPRATARGSVSALVLLVVRVELPREMSRINAGGDPAGVRRLVFVGWRRAVVG